MPVLTSDELLALLHRGFPLLELGKYRIDRVDDGGLSLVRQVGPGDIRPGGTLSGPTLMALADTATYLLVLAHVGAIELAVTSSLTMHFLRKPRPAPLAAEARLLRLGKRLAVAEVLIRSEGADALVAQATVTYSIPR